MKERHKKKLTKEQALQDYRAMCKEKENATIGVFTFGAVGCLLFMLTPILSKFLKGQGGGWILLLVGAVIVCLVIQWRMIAKQNLKTRQELTPECFEITEDYVTKKEDLSNADESIYFVYLKNHGKIRVSLSPSKGRPGYRSVKVGDCVLISKRKGSSEFYCYPRDVWRIDDLSEEQIAAELQQEDELIVRIMECERFPRLTIQNKYYAKNDPRSVFQIHGPDTDARMNFLERLAAKHFCYSRVNAIEYMIRYCPRELVREAAPYFTPYQRNLWREVEQHVQEDEKEAKRAARREKWST